MSLHPPRVRQYVPPSEEEIAESRAAFERDRAERGAAREAARPARRAAILAGPVLRDVEAAVDCMCACHPRPADLGRHDGGQSCPCQETADERAARMTAFREVWNEDIEQEYLDEERYFQKQRELVASEAEVLGVEAGTQVWAAPHVLVGVCDGRSFYLRERHGSYRVTIAPDNDPGSDPWVAEPTEPSIDIAAGDECELEDAGRFSWVVALRVAVQAVRTAAARNLCEHRRIGSEPFCPSCGVRIDDADAWRW
ncbi:MAG: hypothetical protein MUF83_05315 [Acidimicrobiales bacterium]|nr:hypothetical protein [Acidimicrobiales bacterium]